MSLKINYQKNLVIKSSANLVLFCNEKFTIDNFKKYLSKAEFSYIKDILKTSDIKKNLLIFEESSKRKIILLLIKKKHQSSDFENLGAEFYKRINFGKSCDYSIVSDSISNNKNEFLGYFLHGAKLKSYLFNK